MMKPYTTDTILHIAAFLAGMFGTLTVIYFGWSILFRSHC